MQYAYGDCIGGVDAVMGSEWRGLAAALRALADQPIVWMNKDYILAIAAELEGNRG